MLTSIKSNYDSLIEMLNITKRGNSVGLNFSDLLLKKFGIKRPKPGKPAVNLGKMGFFIKCDRTGQTFLAIAKIEEPELDQDEEPELDQDEELEG
jgi:hypothetical protein